MTGLRFIVLATAMLAAGVAIAGPLELAGNYGTPAGCKYLADGDYGDDSAVTLTSEAYDTFATGCEFLQVLRARDGSNVATMLCSHEGETYRTVEFMHIVKADGVDAYDLFSETGSEMGRLERCG